MRFVPVVMCLLLFAGGCSAPPPPPNIDFDGKTWRFDRPAPSDPDNDWGMTGRIYVTNDPTLRLVELKAPDDYAGIRHQVWTVQAKRGEQWIRHGLTNQWFKSGARDETPYVEGQIQGMTRSWHPSGRPASEIPFVDGAEQGHARAWYESGRPKFDVIYVRGEEFSGKSWKENGEEDK